MQVNSTAYTSCIKDAYISLSNSGNDSLVLSEPGEIQYICGVGDHCENGQKLTINVVPWMVSQYGILTPMVSTTRIMSNYIGHHLRMTNYKKLPFLFSNKRKFVLWYKVMWQLMNSKDIFKFQRQNKRYLFMKNDKISHSFELGNHYQIIEHIFMCTCTHLSTNASLVIVLC